MILVVVACACVCKGGLRKRATSLSQFYFWAGSEKKVGQASKRVEKYERRIKAGVVVPVG